MILTVVLLASCGDSGDPRFAADEYLEAYDQNRNLPPIFANRVIHFTSAPTPARFYCSFLTVKAGCQCPYV